MNIECRECFNEFDPGDGINGYCPRCLDRFQRKEAREEIHNETPLGEAIDGGGEID